MKVEKIIEAWKNEEMRAALGGLELSQMPANPAGPLAELNTETLAEISGGSTWACVTVSSWVCGVAATVTICDELQEYFNSGGTGTCNGSCAQDINKYYCFTAQTEVRTPSGLQPIHSFQAGDAVLAFDFEAGAVRESRVRGVDVHDGNFAALDLRSGDSRVEVTHGHHFHDGEQWRPVEHLSDRCLDLHERQQPAAIAGARAVSKVYNLRIKGQHSYFVGEAGLLVRDH